MHSWVGVDGCRGGWLAVIFNDQGEPDVKIFPDIDSLWETYQEALLILIDIPIGLRSKKDEPAKDERACDKEAREKSHRVARACFPLHAAKP